MLRTLPRFSRSNPLKAAAEATAIQSSTSKVGDISSVFPSLSGKASKPLPPRFADIKRNILAGNERGIERSWARLLDAINYRRNEIRKKGSDIIPSVDYSQLHTLSAAQKRDICTRGGVVIRNVLPRDLATSLLSSTRQYISYNASQVRAFPPSNPSVYELYWSPSQVAARSHPHVLNTQRFLQSLWNSSDSSSSSSALSTQHTLTYADRLRIRPPGDSGFSLGPHVDGGSVERWEDPTYRAVYRNIFSGNWEDYDPFDYAYRADANMDLYNSPGGCGMFRMFQGWLSLSTTAPGEGSLKINPMLKEAMAYVLLRPFFRENDGKLYTQAEMMSDLPGAVQGASQEINDLLHPHLHLSSSKSSSMVSIPTVNPGDYVAWHCDTIHSVDPRHTGKQDSAVLYIPAVPLCKMNALYLKRQREAAKVLSVPPDFPGAEVKGVGEEGFAGRLEDWTRVGEEGRRAMGMGERKWEVTENMGVGERTAVEEANRILFA